MVKLHPALVVFALAIAPITAAAQQPATPAQPAAAPQLAAGTWTGVITPPDGQAVDVTYDVTVKNDTLAISINAAQYGTFPAQQIKNEVDKLSFTFSPGPNVQCVLKKAEDGSYAGDCLDEDGSPAHATMIPPKKETPGTN